MNIAIIKSILEMRMFQLSLLVGLIIVILFLTSKMNRDKKPAIVILFVGAVLWGFFFNSLKIDSGVEVSWLLTPTIENTPIYIGADLAAIDGAMKIMITVVIIAITAAIGGIFSGNIIANSALLFASIFPGHFAFIVVPNVIEGHDFISIMIFYIIFWGLFFTCFFMFSNSGGGD